MDASEVDLYSIDPAFAFFFHLPQLKLTIKKNGFDETEKRNLGWLLSPHGLICSYNELAKSKDTSDLDVAIQCLKSHLLLEIFHCTYDQFYYEKNANDVLKKIKIIENDIDEGLLSSLFSPKGIGKNKKKRQAHFEKLINQITYGLFNSRHTRDDVTGFFSEHFSLLFPNANVEINEFPAIKLALSSMACDYPGVLLNNFYESVSRSFGEEKEYRYFEYKYLIRHPPDTFFESLEGKAKKIEGGFLFVSPLTILKEIFESKFEKCYFANFFFYIHRMLIGSILNDIDANVTKKNLDLIVGDFWSSHTGENELFALDLGADKRLVLFHSSYFKQFIEKDFYQFENMQYKMFELYSENVTGPLSLEVPDFIENTIIIMDWFKRLKVVEANKLQEEEKVKKEEGSSLHNVGMLTYTEVEENEMDPDTRQQITEANILFAKLKHKKNQRFQQKRQEAYKIEKAENLLGFLGETRTRPVEKGKFYLISEDVYMTFGAYKNMCGDYRDANKYKKAFDVTVKTKKYPIIEGYLSKKGRTIFTIPHENTLLILEYDPLRHVTDNLGKRKKYYENQIIAFLSGRN
ncbi:MAG: hypothetical protein ACTSXG_01510 [Alphaproteobacteria bacterium]